MTWVQRVQEKLQQQSPKALLPVLGQNPKYHNEYKSGLKFVFEVQT